MNQMVVLNVKSPLGTNCYVNEFGEPWGSDMSIDVQCALRILSFGKGSKVSEP
jgi:hypothetical protein